MIKMKKQYFFLIIILFICQKTLGQQDNAYYQKGLEATLDSLVQENPKIKFYLTNNYATLNKAKDPFGWFFDCDINFDDLKQDSTKNTKIIIPDKYRNRLKKKSFFNKIIYGKRLVGLKIDILYQDINYYVFIIYVYEKSSGIIFLAQIKNNSLEINQFCKAYLIY